MRPTPTVGETVKFSTRHLSVDLYQTMREFAHTYDTTIEDVLNQALAHGLDLYMEEQETLRARKRSEAIEAIKNIKAQGEAQRAAFRHKGRKKNEDNR